MNRQSILDVVTKFVYASSQKPFGLFMLEIVSTIMQKKTHKNY